MAEWEGGAATWIVELGTLAGAAEERREGRRRLRHAVGPGAAARGDDLVVADEVRRLRSALCTRESVDVAGVGSRSVRPGCPARRGVCGVRRWRAGG